MLLKDVMSLIENLIWEFCSEKGVSGREKNILELARDKFSKYGETLMDNSGNIIVKVGNHDDNKKNLLLDAHIDQIGFLVTFIDSSGFVKISPCGGIDPRIMVGASLIIHGKKDLLCTVSTIPPHLKEKESDKSVVQTKDLYVDTGIYDGSIDSVVALGDAVSFNSEPCSLLNGKIASCALDNRAGVVTLIRCADLLSRLSGNYGYNVTFALTVQEETTGKGSATSSYLADPEEAIVVDVSFASQPGIPEQKTGSLGKGPMIGISPVLDRDMFEKMLTIAEKKKIPYQIEVMSGKTSTNADQISVNKNGVKTSVLSVPIRYMHTPYEVVDVTDVENTAKLIFEYIREGGTM